MVGSILVLPLRAFLLTLMQTCSHMPKRSHAYLRGLAAFCRSDQVPHNNAAQIRWPTGSCARVGSRLPRRWLILTSVFFIPFYSHFLNLIQSQFFFFFFCQTKYKCAKITGIKLVTETARQVLFHPVTWSRSWVACPLSIAAGRWLPLCPFFSGMSRTRSFAGSHREWPLLQHITCHQAPLLWLQLFREAESH